MDTSETYIKMCEKAEEIQERFKRSCNYQDAIVWRQTRIPTYLWRVVESDLEHEPYSQHFIWLPRQDQLQEMVGGSLGGQFTKLEQFFSYEPFGYIRLLNTWEQLWLAFVMKERWNKIWSTEKEEWIHTDK